MKRILITGSIAYDLLLSYEGSFPDALKGKDIDRLSVSFVAPHLKRHHGGTGSNIAWNLKLLGGDPLLVGTVGDDGGEYCSLMEERGIDTSHIERRKDSFTATAIIGTDTGERQIAFFHPGPDALGSWPQLSDEQDDVAWSIVSSRDPIIMMQAVRWCGKAGLPLLFDPGQLVIAISPDELRAAVGIARGLICNDYEWKVFTERTGMSASDVLGSAEFLIVTKGEGGAELLQKEKGIVQTMKKIIACKPDHVVNPTGAGDAFRAGLLFGLEKKWDLADCCRLGAAMGSFAVEIEGTLMENLDREDVWERAKETYGEELPQ